jgi:SAM-dependent methyltransferase
MISEIIFKNTDYTSNEYYYSILKPEFKTRLGIFLENYYRAFPSKTGPNFIYPQLPYPVKGPLAFEWKFRAESLKIFRTLKTDLAEKKILEIGPWNSWLSQHLKKENNLLVCADFFTDDQNGLASKKHYTNNKWLSVQCDLENIDFFCEGFDLIILNHNLQFFTEPIAQLRKYKKLLKPGGKIVCLGLSVFVKPQKKVAAVQQMRETCLREKHFEIFLNPTKAFLDEKDKKEMQTEGFSFVPYSGFALRNFYSRLNRSKPFYCLAVYSAEQPC